MRANEESWASLPAVGGARASARPEAPAFEDEADHSVAHETHGAPIKTTAVLPDKATLTAAGEILRALAAPVRIAIVLCLRTAPRCVHELVEALDLPQPLVSQHLRVLREQRVVEVERSGREALYRLADHHLTEIVLAAISHAEEGRP